MGLMGPVHLNRDAVSSAAISRAPGIDREHHAHGSRDQNSFDIREVDVRNAP